MDSKRVYAIIPSASGTFSEADGVDERNTDVYCIPHGNVAAVVSSGPSADLRGMSREEIVGHLVAHQRVIEGVMRTSPVLPVKFGTSFSNTDEVRRLLAQGESVFDAALKEHAGRVQMEVTVMWNLSEVLQEIGQEEEIVRAKSEAGSRGGTATATATMTDLIAVGQMVQASLANRRATLRDRILLPSLQDVANDVVINPIMDDNMVANLALLVDESGRIAMERRLQALDDEFQGRLTFRCVGPLPPYSFATVDVQSPSFEAIDGARERLGLGDSASLEDVRRAYHRLARQFHPDHNLDDSEAPDRMEELTGAYRLLSAYAGTPGVAASAPFDRESVEKTLIIGIRRQESLEDGRC